MRDAETAIPRRATNKPLAGKRVSKMENTVDPPNVKVDPEIEAVALQREFALANEAGKNRVEHAITAGEHLLRVKTVIKRGFQRWLAEHGFSKAFAYECLKLAEHTQSVRHAEH